MKNLKKAEVLIIIITLLCGVFTAGYFVGRSSAAQIIMFEKATPAAMTDAGFTEPTTALSEPEVTTPTSSASENASPVISEDTTEIPQDAPDAAPSSGHTDRTSDIININTASAAELDRLPGIGPVLSQSIIDYRQKHGAYDSIEEIKEVDGIGDKKFEAMKDMITVG